MKTFGFLKLILSMGLSAILFTGCDTVRALIPHTEGKFVKLEVKGKPLGFSPQELQFEVGQSVQLKIKNRFNNHPVNFVLLKDGEDPTRSIFIGRQNGPVKNWLPSKEYYYFASELIEPRESVTIQFEAPKKAGRYVFVSILPVNQPVIQGVLWVTDSSDEKSSKASDLSSEKDLSDSNS